MEEDGAEEEDGAVAAKGKLVRPTEATADPLLIREYVHQLVVPEVTDASNLLLAELRGHSSVEERSRNCARRTDASDSTSPMGT